MVSAIRMVGAIRFVGAGFSRPALSVLCLLVATLASAQINMPDPSMINGRALPAPELPDGTVSVRVVRESVGNNLPGQDVTVTAGSASKSGKTDEGGRAMVTGLPAGAEATAAATVDGEALVSQPFQVPTTGGIRIILIAGLKEAAERKAKELAAEAAAPPIKGTVVFGNDSRVMIEFRDDEIRVYYLLEIVNTARARVDIGGPMIIELPDGAEGATVLEGSTQNATAKGDHVTVVGPFAAGNTPLQIGFGLPHSSSELTISQTWPVALEQVLVMAQKVGNLQIASPQFKERDEARAQNGTPYLLAGGGGLPAKGTLTVTLTGLPIHPAWPRYTALGLAFGVMFIGAWYAFSGGSSAEDAHKRLVDRRESLLGDLVKLEEQRRLGRVDGSKYTTRRQRLMADLERVYGELDGASTGPTGGGEAAA